MLVTDDGIVFTDKSELWKETPDKQDIIDILKYESKEWDKTAEDISETKTKPLFNLCYLYEHHKDCVLHVGNKCANYLRFYDAMYFGDTEVAKKEAAILASTMRWEAYKLENSEDR